MDLKKPFKIPASAIVLDIVGTLLLALGIMDLMQVRIALLGLPSGEPRQGWTLIVFGVVFMTAATMLIIGLLLAKRGSHTQPPTGGRPHH